MDSYQQTIVICYYQTEDLGCNVKCSPNTGKCVRQYYEISSEQKQVNDEQPDKKQRDTTRAQARTLDGNLTARWKM